MRTVPSLPLDTIIQGDCLEVLRTLPDASVDAIVTDPPYGLGTVRDLPGLLAAWMRDEDDAAYLGRGGFMGAEWDAGVPGPRYWREVYRVLKPGAHLIAFAGTRTWDLMALAIRLAGFEMRDSIGHHYGSGPALAWLYGSGFPKSLNVAKQIDARKGAQRKVVGTYKGATNIGRGSSNRYIVGNERAPQTTVEVTEDATVEPQQWHGWGTALKPSWEPALVFRKPLAGTVAENVLAYGTGALHVDACRVGSEARPVMVRTATRVAASAMSGVSTGATTNGEMTTQGRWPPHLVLTHSLWCDEATGCVDGCPVALLDAQSGVRSMGHRPRSAKNGGIWGNGKAPMLSGDSNNGYGDTGGASRYFPVFRYVAKASRRERNAGCETLPVARGPVMSARCRTCGRGQLDGRRMGPCCAAPDYEPTPAAGLVTNHHPTVKPLALMRWLVRLITPPGGLVLDPFAGSGSTLVACVQVGVHYLGIEREAEYVQIAQARVAAASRLPVEEMPDDLPAMTSPTPASEPAPVLAAATSRATTRPSRRRSSKIAPFPAPQPSLWGASALMREWRDLPCVDILL